MKVNVLPEHLSEALKELARVTPKKTALPILADVLAENDAGRLKLTASDLEQTLACWVGAVWEEEGRCILPTARLAKILPRMGEDGITLSCDNGKVNIDAGARSLTLPSGSPDDFPPTPEVGGEWGGIQELADGLKRVAFCASSDDIRPVLAGVHIEANGDTMRLTATDGHRLGHVSRSYYGPAFTGIVPLSAVATLRRLAKGNDVRVRADGTNIVFDLGVTQLTASLIQGTFPNYDNLIPKEGQYRVTVNRDDLRSEVAAVHEIVKESSGVMRLRIGSDSLLIQGQSEGIGDYRASIPAEVTGDGKVALNERYLESLCVALDKGPMTLDWQSASQIIRVRQEGFDGFYLLMPMTAGWD